MQSQIDDLQNEVNDLNEHIKKIYEENNEQLQKIQAKHTYEKQLLQSKLQTSLTKQQQEVCAMGHMIR